MKNIVFTIAAVLFALCTNAAASQNSERVFETQSGTFRIVVSFGSYSKDPSASSAGGLQCNMIQTPDGKWHEGFPMGFPRISEIVDAGDSTFVIASLSNSNEVIFFHYENGEFHRKQTFRGYLSRAKVEYQGTTFYELSRDTDCDFIGFVYYVHGEGWTTAHISRNLDNLGWITGSKEVRDGVFILHLGHIVKMRFEPRHIGTKWAFVPMAN